MPPKKEKKAVYKAKQPQTYVPATGFTSGDAPTTSTRHSESATGQTTGPAGGAGQNNSTNKQYVAVNNNQNRYGGAGGQGGGPPFQGQPGGQQQHAHGGQGQQHRRQGSGAGGYGQNQNQGGFRGGRGGQGGRGGHNRGNSGRYGGNNNNMAAGMNMGAGLLSGAPMMGAMTPQMLAQQPMMLPHMQNIQKMDQVELEGLVMGLINQFGPSILSEDPQALQAAFKLKPGQMGGQNQYQNQRRQNKQGGNMGYEFSNNQQNRRSGAPMPVPIVGAPVPGIAPFQMPQPGGVQAQGGQPGAPGTKKVYQTKPKADDDAKADSANAVKNTGDEESKTSHAHQKTTSSYIPKKQYQAMQSQPGQQQHMQNQGGPMFGGIQQMGQMNNTASTLCEEHFPEPIILFLEKPLCKRCIPEYIAKANNVKKQQDPRGNKGRIFDASAAQQTAKLLGLNTMALNAYQTEVTQISRSLDLMNNFRKEFRMMHEDIREREELSSTNTKVLPPLMNSIFDKLEELVNQAEEKFRNKIFQVVRNSQKNIQEDMKNKLPQFYQRLVQKYGQLQMASNVAVQHGAEELILTLENYHKIFNELDAEYEKYFNDYEKMSKLQRLLDKDANDIVQEFGEMVERSLRVDFNIKSSFGPKIPQRLHSFQWNQRCSQIYRIERGIFEKKQVTMQYEVPLYSRSIATESGTIYLTGGYIKHVNVYLKHCYRYDEIFGTLNQVANMNYPHADHSICAIGGFIYVVGNYVNNQVYGHCEQYDTQKDTWKKIADMRIPRSGVSLCAFKNNYMFAFGGRVDQKRIVDAIEVYDITRNVWQEIQTPFVNKVQWVPSYMGLAYQITDNEIILFGGKSAITFQIFNGCFVFDVEKMEIKERGSLVNPCSFMNTPLVFNNNLYAYGNDIFVHQYDIPEQKWSVIPKTSVVLPKQ